MIPAYRINLRVHDILTCPDTNQPTPVTQARYKAPIIEYHAKLIYSDRATEDVVRPTAPGMKEYHDRGRCMARYPVGAGTTSNPCFLNNATDRFM